MKICIISFEIASVASLPRNDDGKALPRNDDGKTLPRNDRVIVNKKAQVIIIILWILAILAVIAVGVGHRVSMAIRLTVYQRDGAKALCLAQAGINRAIVELGKEGAATDGLNDIWSTGIDAENKKLFDNIEVKEGSGETFTIKYLYDKENNTYLCMADEERKININAADDVLLQALLGECAVTDAAAITKNILFWRGAIPNNEEAKSYYANLGYENKGKNFANTEELILVMGIKDFEAEKLEKLMGLITVFGSGKVNINTCSEEVLRILIKASIVKAYPSSLSPIDAEELVKRVLEHRSANIFTTDDLSGVVDNSGLNQNAFNSILGQLKSYIGFQSQNFRIISTGKISASGIERTIECVYDRGNKKIVFWHEN